MTGGRVAAIRRYVEGDEPFLLHLRRRRARRRHRGLARVPPRARQARHGDGGPPAGPLRRDANRRTAASRVQREAQATERVHQRRLLRPRCRRVLDYLGGDAATVLEREPLQRAGARRAAGRLPPRRLLAADGHAAREFDLLNELWAAGGALEDLAERAIARRPRGPTRATGLRHRPHRLQGLVALPLARSELGAEVTGYALRPATEPSLFELAGSSGLGAPRRSPTSATPAARAAHRAARPGGRLPPRGPAPGARSPTRTRSRPSRPTCWGRLNLLEARPRLRGAVRSVVVVTTDKCYENREWVWGYREDERLGGHDPYAAARPRRAGRRRPTGAASSLRDHPAARGRRRDAPGPAT